MLYSSYLSSTIVAVLVPRHSGVPADELFIVHSFKMLIHIPLALAFCLFERSFAENWDDDSDETVTKKLIKTRYICPCDASQSSIWSAWDPSSTTTATYIDTSVNDTSRDSAWSTSRSTGASASTTDVSPRARIGISWLTFTKVHCHYLYPIWQLYQV